VPEDLVPFFVDECVAVKVDVGLKDAGHFAVHPSQIGRCGYPDPEQFKYAVANGLSVLTYNVGHFKELHAEYTLLGWEHPGIFLATESEYQRDPFGLINDLRHTCGHYTKAYEGGTDWRFSQIWNVIRGKP
jgi:hypothetical protein